MDMKILYALEVLDSFSTQDWEFTPPPSMDHDYQMPKERFQAIKTYIARKKQAVAVKVKDEVWQAKLQLLYCDFYYVVNILIFFFC